jgi:glycine cleavage system H protein
MAFDYPADLKYTDTHEYVRLDGDVATIGITAFAIDQLGDIVFLELPATGSSVSQGGSFGTVESVKAVEDLKCPISGEVVEANQDMVDAPEKLVEDPYQAGWLIKVKVSNPSDLDRAMSAADYRGKVEGA